MNRKTSKVYLSILAALVAGYLMISPVAKAASTSGEDSKEISSLFSDMKLVAHELELGSMVMETFTRSPLSRQSHAAKLNEIGDHINKAGDLLTKLQDSRDKGSAWQQKAIDEIRPLLRELADNTQTAVNHFNERTEPVHMNATYKEYLKANRGVAQELAALITDYVDYGLHKSEFDRLGEKLVASER